MTCGRQRLTSARGLIIRRRLRHKCSGRSQVQVAPGRSPRCARSGSNDQSRHTCVRESSAGLRGRAQEVSRSSCSDHRRLGHSCDQPCTRTQIVASCRSGRQRVHGPPVVPASATPAARGWASTSTNVPRRNTSLRVLFGETSVIALNCRVTFVMPLRAPCSTNGAAPGASEAPPDGVQHDEPIERPILSTARQNAAS